MKQKDKSFLQILVLLRRFHDIIHREEPPEVESDISRIGEVEVIAFLAILLGVGVLHFTVGRHDQGLQA